MKDLIWVWATRLGLAAILRHLADAAMKDISSGLCLKPGRKTQDYLLFVMWMWIWCGQLQSHVLLSRFHFTRVRMSLVLLSIPSIEKFTIWTKDLELKQIINIDTNTLQNCHPKDTFILQNPPLWHQLSQRPQLIICGDRLFFAILNLTQTKHLKKSSYLKVCALWMNVVCHQKGFINFLGFRFST